MENLASYMNDYNTLDRDINAIDRWRDWKVLLRGFKDKLYRNEVLVFSP
jgi:hypothetical protein